MFAFQMVFYNEETRDKLKILKSLYLLQFDES